MATKKKSSAEFPGVGFTDAVLRVVLSGGGTFDNEDERQAAQHFAIMAMHPDDVDRDGRGPGKIIADFEPFDGAEKFADLFAAAPEILAACTRTQNILRLVRGGHLRVDVLDEEIEILQKIIAKATANAA